jgi:hypothetical protein
MVKIAIQPLVDLSPSSGTAAGKLAKYTRLLADAKEIYEDVVHHFAHLTYLTERDRIELGISYGYLNVIVPHANNSDDRNLLFQILKAEKVWQEAKPQDMKVQRDGSLKPKEPNHRIPLTSEEAFRKYVQRAKDKGIVTTLVNQGRGKKRPHLSVWTEVMQFLVILYAVCKPTKTSYGEISRDIANLLTDHPELKGKGVSLVAPSTIGEQLRDEGGKVLISFAKDNLNAFKRKVIGVLRFLPPSSPLVQVGVDGYHVQTICADDETQKPIQLVALVIYDFKTKAVLGLAFGKSENNVVYRRAWQDYFATTGNRLPREIVMDKFIGNHCQGTRNLNLLFEAHGVHITRSSNPNNNGRLERFFGVTQDFYQGSVLSCSYVGSSITSSSDNARPGKSVQMTIRKSAFIKGESEMIHLLTYIFKEAYNKNFKAVKGQAPMEIFTEEESNHVAKISEAEVAYATYEPHRCTIVGCGVIIKKDKQLFLYKNRSKEVIKKFFRKQVDVFVDRERPTGGVYVFQMGVRRHLFDMTHIEIVPGALYDRTRAHKDFVRRYKKESRELIAAFQAEFEHMGDAVDMILEGVDYKASREATKIKKEADGAYLQAQIGLVQTKPEPPQAFINAPSKPSTQKKKVKQTSEELLISKYGL